MQKIKRNWEGILAGLLLIQAAGIFFSSNAVQECFFFSGLLAGGLLYLRDWLRKRWPKHWK